MVDTIYLERQVIDLERTQAVLQRYPRARQIVVEKYGEVFNSHAQNFRLQKNNPSLILAAKNNNRVLPTPPQYETGGGANYYFSHMLNCLYDCRYCFLQGMYRSANYLLFVNYQDFVEDIKRTAIQHQDDAKPAWFFSGYDCDSLAYEPVSGFAEYFLQAFADIPHAVLELRTKSTQIRSLLNHPPQSNIVVAYSLSPPQVADHLESGAPDFNKRLQALEKLQQCGWRIGIRFDPVIWHEGYLHNYQSMIDKVFTTLDCKAIDSVTVGGFRLPKGNYKTIRKLYPEHWLFSAGLQEQAGVVAYKEEIEQEAFSTMQRHIFNYVPEDLVYCYPSHTDS